MSRRMPSPYGWNPGEQPVGWSYSVAFKAPRSNKLYWVHTDERTPEAASRVARPRRPRGTIEYGVSKTHWRYWHGGRQREIISSIEYKEAATKLSRAPAI